LSTIQKYQRDTTNTELIDIFRFSGNSKKSYSEKSTDNKEERDFLGVQWIYKCDRRKIHRNKEERRVYRHSVDYRKIYRQLNTNIKEKR
jgi:hypothetical protein